MSLPLQTRRIVRSSHLSPGRSCGVPIKARNFHTSLSPDYPGMGVPWIVAAVQQELALLKDELNARSAGMIGGLAYYEGRMAETPVFLGVTGVGVVPAALALGGLLAALKAHRVIMIGSAGALPGSGLIPGDVVIASAEVLSEMGVCTGSGMGAGHLLGLAAARQEVSFDQQLSQSLLEAAEATTGGSMGRFLTVVGVSADETQARSRAKSFGTVAENMEGYALALAGAHFRIQVGEMRAISNRAGVRDKAAWDLDAASERVQAAVLSFLKRVT